jgi:phosphoribosylformylglycinamidine cyclo-ligase
LAHITGGGLIDNVPRMLPDGLAAHFRRAAWQVPPLFQLIQRAGEISDAEMFRTFNMGLGMVLAVAPDHVAAVRARLPEALIVGEVVPYAGEGPRVLLA